MTTGAIYDKQTAIAILQSFRKLQASGLLEPGVIQNLVRGGPQFIEEPKRFTNNSGETIPPYACMQITGTEVIGDVVYLQVDKPADTDGTVGAYIFNWHYEVEDGKQGVAQFHRILRAYSNGDAVTAGDKWIPVVGAWTVKQDDSGQFTICGEDQTASDLYTVPIVKIAIDGGGGGSGASIEYTIDSIEIAGTTSPYNGLVVATVTIETAPCDRSDLIGTQVEVVDHSGCVFDLEEADLVDVWGWASERIAISRENGVPEGTLTPCHWCADDRCCTEGEGGGTSAPATPTYTSKTANYTLTSTDRTVNVLANSITITLPTAVGIVGTEYIIKNSGTGTVSIATTSSQTVDSEAPSTISLDQGDSLTVQSNGADWIII